MEVTALRQYRRYLESIDKEVRNTPKSEYIDVLSPGEVLDLLTIRDEISQIELSAEEKRELNSLDDLLIRHYWLIAQNIPVTDEPRSRWWWHLHEGPEVRERASLNSEESERLRAQLERLPTQIRQYYGVYFSELRSQLTRPDLFSEAVPDFLMGYKRVISIGGKDGVVVVHFHIETEITLSETDGERVLIRFPSVLNATEDAFDFITFPESPVIDLVNFISGGEDVGAISPGMPWGAGVAGVFNEPQLKVDPDTGQVTWQAPWTRLAFADFNHLYVWEDTGRARREAREDLEHYVRGLERKELDEIRAPEDIEEARVKAGDRGVVVEVFPGRPADDVPPALLVEYADLEGQTKALVTYSTDLETILDVFVDRDFLANREWIPDRNETIREQTLDFPANSPVIPGRLVAV